MKYEKRSRTFGNNHTKIIIVGVVAVCLVVAGLFGGYRWLVSEWEKPAQEISELVLFEVEETESIAEVAKRLENAGIIRKASVFEDAAKSMDFVTVIAGEFAVDRSWSVKEIAATLADESERLEGHLNIMFPPGYWAKDFAHKLANLTHLEEADILAKWQDETFVRALQNDYDFLTDEIFEDGITVYLEGYLYPETYNFLIDTTIEEATRIILNQTQVIYDQYRENFEASSYSVHQLFTLASMVNYEAATSEDMKLVAQVFYNRLADDMLLQSSVTVCYAVYDYTSWTDCEENTDTISPYNTYLNKGLPIGPVMNPVSIAFDAIFNPTPTKALYFVADVETGEMYFAQTYEEHQKNVEEHVDIYR